MARESAELRALIDRLARHLAADDRMGDLNPAQARALDYLSRANRFSRAPSHVADYLGATRGTVSQTLKALERKGLIQVVPNREDRRSHRYDLTADGANRAGRDRASEAFLDRLAAEDREALDQGLRAALAAVCEATGAGAYGICGLCRHHEADGGVRRCTLWNAALAPPEAAQICHRQEPAA